MCYYDPDDNEDEGEDDNDKSWIVEKCDRWTKEVELNHKEWVNLVSENRKLWRFAQLLLFWW